MGGEEHDVVIKSWGDLHLDPSFNKQGLQGSKRKAHHETLGIGVQGPWIRNVPVESLTVVYQPSISCWTHTRLNIRR